MTTTCSNPRTARRARRGTLAALGAAALLTSGCGTGSGGVTPVAATSGSGGSTSAAAPESTSADRGTAAGDETAAAGTAAVTTSAEPAPTGTDPVIDPAAPTAPAAVLSNVRWSNRGSYDRLVLDFSGPFGGYQVQYVDSLTEDPTGDPVELAGGAVLAVSIQGATRNNAFQTSDTTALKTYGGPARVAPNLPNLKEVADAGDFEAVLTFGVGLDRKAGFKVMRLTGPDRLVVDVAH